MKEITIVGAGLSGCEAALQAADRGIKVKLFEMRPNLMTGAHQTGDFAELVCSNSFGSEITTRPSGLLMSELEKLGSHLINIAKSSRVPAGHALAIDRKFFSQKVTEKIISNPNIEIIREEITSIPSGLVVIASGPLTSQKLSASLISHTGKDNLFFYDAVAPIIEYDSIDMEVAFWGSRYGRGKQVGGDYINCPFDKNSYSIFINELVNAERIELKGFEKDIDNGVRAGKSSFFEGCLPIEIMAQRGEHTLAFGPLRPVGLTNPHHQDKPYAVAQLRQDDLSGETFNLVGFQTNLKFSEQQRVFRLIPGLDNAEFVRYGQMHRNTFIASPEILNSGFQLKKNPDIYFCGQITGVEGYLSNIASGLFVGINISRYLNNLDQITFPKNTMIGSLFDFVINTPIDKFQPMKPNFGLLPQLRETVKPKKIRFEMYAVRAQQYMDEFLLSHAI
jgi:methylenetetrahydrofolate--tRNA-(uracil-5-)-methyltransferase